MGLQQNHQYGAESQTFHYLTTYSSSGNGKKHVKENYFSKQTKGAKDKYQ